MVHLQCPGMPVTVDATQADLYPASALDSVQIADRAALTWSSAVCRCGLEVCTSHQGEHWPYRALVGRCRCRDRRQWGGESGLSCHTADAPEERGSCRQVERQDLGAAGCGHAQGVVNLQVRCIGTVDPFVQGDGDTFGDLVSVDLAAVLNADRVDLPAVAGGDQVAPGRAILCRQLSELPDGAGCIRGSGLPAVLADWW